MQFTVGLLKVIDERLGKGIGTAVLVVVVAAIVATSLWIVLALGSNVIMTISALLAPILTGRIREVSRLDVVVGVLSGAALLVFFSLIRSIITALRGLAGIAEDQNEVAKEMHRLITVLTERVRRLEQGR